MNDRRCIKKILIQDVKNAADRSYMIAMVRIGAGIAGIVIAAFSLSRKRTIEL